MSSLLLRTLAVYLMLLISMRIMGKRQIGELQVTEFIVTFMLSELATIPIIDPSVPLFRAAVPILALLVLEMLFSLAVSKFPLLKKLAFGAPSVLIRKGRLDQSVLRKNRIDVSELLAELRIKDVSDISAVSYAILEDNGKISVVRSDDDPLAHPVVFSGRISPKGLEMASLTEESLFAIIRREGILPEDIYLMTVTDGGEYNIIINE